MNVYFPTSARPTSAPRRIRARTSPSRNPLLWVSGVLASATVIFTIALVAAKLLSQDAVALEIAPPEPDPFYQQKLDAIVQELPAQF